MRAWRKKNLYCLYRSTHTQPDLLNRFSKTLTDSQSLFVRTRHQFSGHALLRRRVVYGALLFGVSTWTSCTYRYLGTSPLESPTIIELSRAIVGSANLFSLVTPAVYPAVYPNCASGWPMSRHRAHRRSARRTAPRQWSTRPN